MHGHKPDKFVLQPKDKVFLHELLRDGHTPLKVIVDPFVKTTN
jgi:hypothetical protein